MLVPCMVVLPDRHCDATGGVQAQQEECLLYKCGLFLGPEKDKLNQILNTQVFYSNRKICSIFS